MKILWVVNLMLPDIAMQLGLPYSNREGWLSGIFNKMNGEMGGYELAVAFPVSKDSSIEPLYVRNIKCFPFKEDLNTPYIYDAALEEEFKNIIEEFKPDILHIFGTEFPHGLASAKVFGDPSKTLVGIQGICTLIAEDYMANIPEKVQKGATFRDVLKKDSLTEQQSKFMLRAENERKLLKIAGCVTGRTDFDKNFTKKINPDRKYYLMHETMRKSFYEGKWNSENIRKNRIFIGQGDYPLKGMHFLLEAAGKVKSEIPDLEIVVAGNSIIDCSSLKKRIKLPQYGKYLRKLIKKYKLSNHVRILGPLTEEAMKEQYLKANVFILPSYVENSPNTIAEAMLLGMPVIASDAGGITSVISEKEGYIFKRGNVEELSELIKAVLLAESTDSEKVENKCDQAAARAKRDYDPSENSRRLFEIYDDMMA